MMPLVLPDLVNGHDVRMVQFGGGLGFGLEALHGLGEASEPPWIILMATVRLSRCWRALGPGMRACLLSWKPITS